MNENRIAQLVKKIAEENAYMHDGKERGVLKEESKIPSSIPTARQNVLSRKLTREDYPIGDKHPNLAKSLTGKGNEDIKIDKVLSGEIKPEDIRISPEVLDYQAQVAESVGKVQFAENLKRAAEMTRIPDEKVLKLYEMLRPNRSTYNELMDAANELENLYKAKKLAELFKEAANVYRNRKVVKQ